MILPALLLAAARLADPHAGRTNALLLPDTPNRCEQCAGYFLFLGSDEAGENTAGLYSLVATCQANGVNPEAYLADVLLRVQTHPAADIDALLPDRWRPLDSS